MPLYRYSAFYDVTVDYNGIMTDDYAEALRVYNRYCQAKPWPVFLIDYGKSSRSKSKTLKERRFTEEDRQAIDRGEEIPGRWPHVKETE